jgi:long-subunit fatty acid transport protein
MTRTTTVLAVALLGLAVEAGAQTNGYLLPCSAASQLARGCVTLSGSGDPAGLLSHPAGLAGRERAALSLSAAAFMPSLNYRNAVNTAGADGESNVYPLPAVAFAARSRGDFTWGLGAVTMGGMGADYRLTHALLGPNQRYHSKFGLMRGGAAAAWQATPALALGVSAGLLYGQLEFATPYAVNPQSLAGLAGLGQDPDYQPMLAGFSEAIAYADMSGLSGTAFTGSFSLAYRASPQLTLALAYTLPSTLTLGGGTAAMNMNAQFGQLYGGMIAAKGGDTATVNAQLAGFGINLGAGMATNYGVEVDFGVPQTLTLALGYRASTRLGLAVDVGWVGYASAFDQFPIRLSDGSSQNINILVNGDPADGTFTTAWPLRWKDTWTVRAGVDYTATPALMLHGGAIYNTNPVASSGLFTIFPAIAQTALTAGLAYQVGATTLQLTYAHTFASEQQAATPHIVASEYAGSTSRLGERTLSAGALWRF